ncbi:MAG: hypothetical protein Q9210_001947 [Variospora velana]
MADIVLYEEDSRPYERPPQMHDQSRLQKKSPGIQRQVRVQVVDMFEMLQLVLDPLAMQMRHLRGQVNVNDLLRKLKWYTVLFEPIVGMNIFTAQERATIQGFQEQVDKLLRRQGIHNEDLNPRSGKMPVIPITDLLMGVCFDARPWTTIDALRNANVDNEVIKGRGKELSHTDITGFRRVIQESPMTMLALPTADDVAFAMDAKGMKVKDACARCLAHRFGGSRLLGQRELEESLTSDNPGFWTLFTSMYLTEIETGHQAAAKLWARQWTKVTAL